MATSSHPFIGPLRVCTAAVELVLLVWVSSGFGAGHAVLCSQWKQAACTW